MDKLVTGLSKNGSVICYTVDCTDTVKKAELLQQTSPVATAALGRLLAASSIMGSQLKSDKENLTLRIKGDGPLGAVIAVSDHEGNVRGYVENRVLDVPLNESGMPDVGRAVGSAGSLTVMREVENGEPYVGSVELVSGEIAEDITAYYAYSEQIPTVCALGVMPNEEGKAMFAGGFIAQLMPGHFDEDIDNLEKNIEELEPITTLLSQGKTPEEITQLVLKDMDAEIISTKPVEYRCNCSRERVDKALISIGKEDLESLRDEDETTEVSCHFCNKIYRYNKEEIQQLIDRATSKTE